MRGVYESMFVSALDLRADFEKYYRTEYVSFRRYLHKRHRFWDDDASAIQKEYDENAQVIVHWQRPLSLFDDEAGEQVLNCLLEQGVGK
jgi:hypothetical protein